MGYSTYMTEEEKKIYLEEEKKKKTKIKKLVTFGVILLAAIVLATASFTVISPTQRGVRVTLGKAGDVVLSPGLVVKTPFIQTVKKYDLSPKSLEMKFSIGDDAAVTSDMQSVACNLVVYWIYDEARILDIVNGYSDTALKTLVRDNTLGAIKEIIGKYSIYDIVEKQEEVTEKVKTSLINRLSSYPVVISSVTINNWDWSAAFDEQIQATMTMTQKVKIAQQELEVTKQQAQKQVAEATAAKEKAVIEAEMKVEVEKQNALAAEAKASGEAKAAELKAEGTANAAIKLAEGEAEAKKLEGEALARYYEGLVDYSNVIEILRGLDIEEVRAKQWDGKEIADFIPLTASGVMVSL